MEKDINDPKSVTELIQKLPPEFGELVEAVRKIILNTNQAIGEQIKWNSPSFFYTGEMKPFNPKEYKRDMAVMHLRQNKVLLVLPTGAIIKKHTGILEGNYTDGRRLITINNLNDAKNKASDLREALTEWIGLIE